MPTSTDDVSVEVEVSSDLETWVSGNLHLSETVSAVDADTRQVTVVDNMLISASTTRKRFIRLKASLISDPSVFVNSPIFGANEVDVLGGPSGASDNHLSFSKFQRPIYRGRIASVSGSEITVTGDPNWTANSWLYAAGVQPNHYYVHVDQGDHEGRILDVSGNGEKTLSLVIPPEVSLTPDLAISLIPHWSLNTWCKIRFV